MPLRPSMLPAFFMGPAQSLIQYTVCKTHVSFAIHVPLNCIVYSRMLKADVFVFGCWSNLDHQILYNVLRLSYMNCVVPLTVALVL